ncbi:MAG: hypothetical protein HFG20_10385 [Anaerotruncus sp.]|nr:hypothetical protein [Anaerotruncus sp.]
MDVLMQMASQKMGTDPQTLRQQLENGNAQNILNGLSPAQRAQINNLMNNPAAIEQLIANPKVQQLLKGLMGK